MIDPKPWRAASTPTPKGQSALSPGAITLLVLAALMVALGFARLPDHLLDIGVVVIGVFIAVVARICQARDQHLALCRLLGDRVLPPRR
ncbi:hypothetical protein KQ945_04675 [Bacillus subtilis subsp. subtilis]|nr:hypothetical protein [Bacillus subtilis subsp. subtilis]